MKRWIYFTWFNFAVNYRKTFLGPIWIIIGPSLFILTLGVLFSHVNRTNQEMFIPHLTVGLICWTLISGFVNGSTKIFQRNRAQIMQGNMSLIDITLVEILTVVLQFFHQLVILVFVFIWFDLDVSFFSLVSIIGFGLLIVNGIWLTIVFGLVGARYRDLSEIVSAIMRIAFLATPILWIPGESGRGQLVSAFMIFNPFYHFIEIFRAPLLGKPVNTISIVVILVITITGSILAYHFYKRFSKQIPLWV